MKSTIVALGIMCTCNLVANEIQRRALVNQQLSIQVLEGRLNAHRKVLNELFKEPEVERPVVDSPRRLLVLKGFNR